MIGRRPSLDPFLLARHVQKSGGVLRLTPDMKLVATVVPPGALAKGARSQPIPAPSTPAADATRGRELLREARRVLSGLAACASGAGDAAVP